MNMTQWITDIRDQSVYWLASRIEIEAPDALTSHGAVFLVDVRNEFIENLLTGAIHDEDSAQEAGCLIGALKCDGGVAPLHPQAGWITYVDLCLWAEDPEEYTGSSTPDANVTQHMYDMLQGCAEKLVMELWYLFEEATQD